ncbi:MAG: PEP-CTERM sorting domain-containing protein [Phycisphaeraceae bacterium]
MGDVVDLTAFDVGNPYLETNYTSGAWISMAVKESPEPGTITLVAIGGLVLLRRRRAA